MLRGTLAFSEVTNHNTVPIELTRLDMALIDRGFAVFEIPLVSDTPLLIPAGESRYIRPEFSYVSSMLLREERMIDRLRGFIVFH